MTITYKPRELERASWDSIQQNTVVPVELYDNDSEVPLTTLWNTLLASRTEDVVVLLNDDVFPAPGWDTTLLEVFQDPSVWVAAPGANTGPQTVDVPRPPRIPPSRPWLERVGKDVWDRYGRHYADREVFGFAYAVRRSAWERLGGFDESIPFYGNEQEFNSRVRASGGRVVKVYGSYVYHVGGKTRNRPRASWAKEDT